MEQIDSTPQREQAHYALRISIIDLVMLMLKDWLWMTIFCVATAAFGVYVAISIPKFYRSNVMLAPEEAQGMLGGNVSSLASMVGLDMKLGTNDAIYPEIYPNVMHSTDFLVQLFDTPVATADGSVKTSYRDYLAKHQKSTWWDDGIKTVLGALKTKPASTPRPEGVPIDPGHLTYEEDLLAQAVDASIKCMVDKKTDVIEISVEAQDPLVAKTMVDSVTSQLQQYITDYRTRKARADLAYLEKVYDEAKRQYDAARTNYAAVSTAHQDVVMETARSMVKALENDMQLKYSIFSQVAEQKQLAQANVQKMTPAFTIIKNSTVPVKHSNMPKIVIVLVFAMLGFFARTIVLFAKHRNTFIQKV